MSTKRIALITNFLVEEYFIEIYKGILEEIQKHDFKLAFIPVGDFDHSDINDNKRNQIFEIVQKENFDGLIIIENLLFNYRPHTEFPEILNRFASIPSIGIGDYIPGLSHIATDNAMGISMLVEHLFEHGCRKIAYIGGPKLNPDAKKRKKSFLENIKKKELICPQNFVHSTTFYPGDTSEAISEILKNNKTIPDAIICANDIIAADAIEQLKKHKFQVPDDIKVCGFDDSTYAVEADITSIKQLIKEQGGKAVKYLDKVLHGYEQPEITYVPVELVCRNSCGCTRESNVKYFQEHKYSAHQNHLALNIHRTAQNLSNIENMHDLKKKLEESFQWMSVKNAAILLLSSIKEKGKIFIAKDDFSILENLKESISYSEFIDKIFNLIPPGNSAIFLPLFSKKNYLGIFVISQNNSDLVLYENLAMQAGSAIHSVLQLEKINLHIKKIESSLNEKEILLKEIHHRVKNNLQIISSLINLKKHDAEFRTLEEIITDLQANISSIALVHEAIYQESEFNSISLFGYFQSLFSLIFQMNMVSGEISFKLLGEDYHLILQKAITCGLIFCELFLNAFKHGFKNRQDQIDKQISIEIEKVKADQLQLIFQDNGAGFSLDENNRRGFGSTIISSLIKQQLNGDIHVETKPGKGTKYTITIHISD